MSPDHQQVLPARWNTFWSEVDGLLRISVELHCLGGFVLAALYGLPRPTGDVDYIAAIPSNIVADLDRIAGQGSALNKKRPVFPTRHGRQCARGLADRLAELFPEQFTRLRLLALEVHDLVLAKLVRNSPVDLEDAKFLAKSGKLDETVLRQRYEPELRPYLANESRHDLTLNLWLEACFHS